MKISYCKWKYYFTISSWIVFSVFNAQKVFTQSVIRFTDSTIVKDSLLFTNIPRDSFVTDTIPFDSLYEATTVQQFLRTSGAFFSPADSLFLRIFSHDDLMKYYHGDFADLLWNIAGFYIHDLGSYGKPISASMNGLSNRHILVMMDGVPLNEADIGWANLNAVTLENIDRIEFFRGNASALHGEAASGGYINIIKRDFEPEKPLTSMKFRSAFSSFEDIGIFFGRDLGSHIRISGGGSSKQTPGEQVIQGFLGGFQRNIQSTRYTGRSLFFNADVYFQRNWSFNFYTQGNKDKYDAYGRNRYGDLKAFDFVNIEGFRKDERVDYHFGLTRRDETSWLQSKLYFANIDRQFDNFSTEIIPAQYSVHSVGADVRYSHRIGHNILQGGATYDRQTLNQIETQHADYSRYAFFLSDQWTIGNLIVQPSARWQHHSVFNSTVAMNFNSAFRLNPQVHFTINAGYTEVTPSLIDEVMTGHE
ncbi:TonB-dependent receptor plug domain-containing protein, partial [bacterium]|nr:TonB-dependent receptor plug domain-containing protein [bacterium]